MTATFHRPWLVPEMEEAIYSLDRTVILEGATKTGKTSTAVVWLLEQALEHGKPGRSFWWVGSVFSTSEIAYRRMLNGLSGATVKRNESKLTITLPNGAIIAFKSAERPDSLYGDDVYAAVGDEVSRWKQQAWHALRTTLTATRGPVRLLYNTRGRGHFAYKLAQRVKHGDEAGASYHMFTADLAVQYGLYPREELEAAQRDLPEQIFRELYYCEPSDDGGNPFGLQHIAARIAPLSDKPAATFGIDLARSHDWTVCIGLDADGAVCLVERWQSPWEMTFSRILAIVGRTPALVDSTGVGDPIVERLQSKGSNYQGFPFTQSSKQDLMQRLAVAIQQGEVSFPEGVIPDELEVFEYEYSRTGVRYSAPPGLHDDAVCALALAVYRTERAKRRPPVVSPFSIERLPPWQTGHGSGQRW